MQAIQLSELYQHFQNSTGICTDTRAIKKDGMFWALKGANFDGNKFASSAIQAGAKFAVVDDPEMAVGENVFLVKEGLKSLQELANYHRRQFEIPMIAITGSNGKTTTKELAATILSQAYNCHFTKGNLNNHIGVPLTLLAMSSETEVAIIEMGANHQGEITELCSIAEPTHGIITNIGKAHLEGFGGLEGVKKGKSELYKYLAENNGVAFVNQSENFLEELSTALKHRRVQYGIYNPQEQTKWLRVQPLKTDQDFVSLNFWPDDETEVSIYSNLIGNYNISNLATAVCLGLYFKVPSSKIKAGLESYIPSNNRSQVVSIPGGKIILDAYNANPSSMEKALLNFKEMPGGEKWVFLGAMKELGAETADEHINIAELAKKMNFKQVILVGEEFKVASNKNEFRWYPNMQKLKASLGKDFFSNKQILIKGSRSIQLEQLVEGINS